MDCTQSEKRMPLYVSGDLTSEDSAHLRSHLEHCAHCQKLRDEFVITRIWLQEGSLPNFDEAFYTQLQASVRTEIAKQQATQSSGFGWRWLADGVSLLRQPRFVLATAGSLLLLLTWLGIRTLRPLPAFNDRVARDERPSPSPAKQDANSANTNLDTVAAVHTTRGRTRRVAMPRIVQTPVLNSQVEEQNQEFKTGILNQDSMSQPEPAEPEVLRMELQTNNPKIRIIWLAPKSTEPKEAKKTPETLS